jgi:hypothetical protein
MKAKRISSEGVGTVYTEDGGGKITLEKSKYSLWQRPGHE